jgi:hypothetical protein
MPFARHCTTAIAVLFAAAGSLAAQDAVQGTTAADPQVPAAAIAPDVQQAPVTTPAPEAQPVSYAPFAATAAVGVHSAAPAMPAPIAPMPNKRQDQGVTLMIIGGAALLGGAIIGGQGGTLIAVGGIVVGAIGLYKYLN